MDRALGHMEKAALRDEEMILHLYNDLRLLNAVVDELVNVLPEDAAEPPAPFYPYGVIKDAKRRILENLFASASAAPIVEIVKETGLPFDLVSLAVGDLETEVKVSVTFEDGMRWVAFKQG